ncbi:MAG: hypothetical protein H7175_05695 [Burkholderiales bacterium]|nr:hypothetical protein [Anaerolineae bacterium]
MADLRTLFRAVDELSREELKQLREYVEHRQRNAWWIVPPENLAQIAEVMRPVREAADQMSEDEINAAIDEAINEVRRERKQNPSRD